VVSKREVIPQDERAPESCLHCEINDLVQEHVEGLDEPVDIVALAANIAESLVDLILLAPEEEQANLLAVTIGHVGHTFLEKSGAVEGGSDTAHCTDSGCGVCLVPTSPPSKEISGAVPRFRCPLCRSF
jgi:hypothetical protein